MYTIVIRKSAARFFKKQSATTIELIKKKLNQLQYFPAVANLKKLQGSLADYYRLRIGDIRVIFHVDTTNQLIEIDTIDYRGNVYG